MKKKCVVCGKKKEFQDEFTGIVTYENQDVVYTCSACKEETNTHMVCRHCGDGASYCWVQKDIMKLTDEFYSATGEQTSVCPQFINHYILCECGLYTQNEDGVCNECN